MAVDPIEFLVTPRIYAGFVMTPLLSVFFGLVGSYAAQFVACGIMGLDPSVYWTQFMRVVDPMDLIHCLVKGSVFGIVFTTLGCFFGYCAFGGAKSVGVATRNTVVVSCLVILFSDYILTSILPFGFGYLTVQ
jgi:phospholipid/cholesterol/gamma-HCH transport system permease protein